MRSFRILIRLSMLLFLPGLLVPSCETGPEERIPYVKVDEYLLLYADLADMGIGTTKVISGGWKGIVLFREADLVFHAYRPDLHPCSLPTIRQWWKIPISSGCLNVLNADPHTC